jgi:hypothetical protein
MGSAAMAGFRRLLTMASRAHLERRLFLLSAVGKNDSLSPARGAHTESIVGKNGAQAGPTTDSLKAPACRERESDDLSTFSQLFGRADALRY